MIGALRQINSMQRLWRGGGDSIWTDCQRMARVWTGWDGCEESQNPRDHSSSPAQQLLLTSARAALPRRIFSWTIRCIEWAGFPVYFPFFILYCEVPGPESQPWETPASPTRPSPGMWSQIALEMGQSSQTQAEGAIGTRRLTNRRGPSQASPHYFSLNSRIQYQTIRWSDWSHFWKNKVKPLSD